MGSEQSQQQATTGQIPQNAIPGRQIRPNPNYPQRLQRGNTIATPQRSMQGQNDEGGVNSPSESRPVSPPMSICSDSDLPYISYTDKPIGDSPKLRNKGQNSGKSVRPNSVIVGGSSNKQSISGFKSKVRPNTAHNIVVVKAAAKQESLDKDPDIVRLQNIPQFLPVMRGTLSLPANRDPEVLERLQPLHMNVMCSRLQSHFNVCANKVASDQQQINDTIKEIDKAIQEQHLQLVERQKAYSQYAETFNKVRQISQQLSRCNTMLNETIESMETLNNFLPVEHRLEPFVWKTG
ncbi:BLOC-1-related complex subunit 5 [Culicoides brevitarsis]|uniref:BLOC-1-related complex subunit 5 n=1 Tax=Culicoides brevitarsis TaxID=469753 RepID=UPI00307B5E9A